MEQLFEDVKGGCVKPFPRKLQSNGWIANATWTLMDRKARLQRTKILAHVLGQPGCGICRCTGEIPPEYNTRYKELFSRKTIATKQRQASTAQKSQEIDDLQRRAIMQIQDSRAFTPRGFIGEQGFFVNDTVRYAGTASSYLSRSLTSGHFSAGRKRPPEAKEASEVSLHVGPKVQKSRKANHQLYLTSHTTDKNAPEEMDVAISDLIHSNGLHFGFGADMKFEKVLDIARILTKSYKPPGREDVSGKFLDAISSENWKESTSSLLKEARDFGILLCSDGATIIRHP